MNFDVAIVGSGPAGATCAALCAQAGLKTALIERTQFPREKVCGDCLNPACWPIFKRLDLETRILALPHSRLEEVEFIAQHGASIRVPLARQARGEIAIKRSLLDQLLLTRAGELGAAVFQNHTVTKIDPGWILHTTGGSFSGKIVVAADGRNSTVARLLNLLPASARDRIGLQTHLSAPANFGSRVALHFLKEGYCGAASIGDGELNLCLVSRPRDLDALKTWALNHFQIAADPQWRTISPLSRAPIAARNGNLLLIGDAARVVEPFTGEGIYYALSTGELAARHIVDNTLDAYPKAHAALYRGRLWINEISRFAVTHPRVATAILATARVTPGILRFLTRKVIGS
ncbi:MAG: Geranylgeranyl reductase [Chthoniobacteraceae bacterium]|nr:Geranylgeranyl reductase [Chthoniobacteraceae bacterium]